MNKLIPIAYSWILALFTEFVFFIFNYINSSETFFFFWHEMISGSSFLSQTFTFHAFWNNQAWNKKNKTKQKSFWMQLETCPSAWWGFWCLKIRGAWMLKCFKLTNPTHTFHCAPLGLWSCGALGQVGPIYGANTGLVWSTSDVMN